MGRALRWTYKLLRAWRDDGFRGMMKAGVNRIILKGEAQDHEYSSPILTVWDVLFVNGCPPEQAPHPYRYRVLHQMEQLRAAGYTVTEMSDAECRAETALSAQVIVFYRCPYTERIGKAIRAAKALNRRVVFDIDDLVIDTAYTDTIPAVQAFSRADRALYDEGVQRYGATMRMCEAATTSTTRLQEELRKYVNPVYINRNCASEKMWKLSEAAWRKKEGCAAGKMEESERKPGKAEGKAGKRSGTADCGEVLMGYFSGTLTHNADFEMIKPAVLRVMDENPQVSLLLMGQLDVPKELEPYGDRVIRKPFTDWEMLPEIIAEVDLNLVPVESTVFNEAKSENKWVEASLVKTATAASRTGALSEMIRDGETGFLVSDGEWYDVLTAAVRDPKKCRAVAENAYKYCRAHCVTIRNAGHVREIYEKLRAPHAACVLPSFEISGGIMVALRHACFLQDAGWSVDLITPNLKEGGWTEFGHHFASLSYKDGACDNQTYYDLMIATMWTTVDFIRRYPRVGRRVYLVQNYETDFYDLSDPQRLECEGLYFLDPNWQYLTISEWCAGWLKKRYGQDAGLMKNGLDRERFKPVSRSWTDRKIRILIEGDCAAEYKNVDESFRIAEKLDQNRFEIWYMSYNAEPKEKYRYDRFLHAVPYDQVADVYSQCDILLKSSWLESFSYPPLEMMATGGWTVVVQNGGNSEYLKDGENCLFYPLGDEEAAVRAIDRIVTDEDLREKLRENGLKTADERDWSLMREEILQQYLKAAALK